MLVSLAVGAGLSAHLLRVPPGLVPEPGWRSGVPHQVDVRLPVVHDRIQTAVLDLGTDTAQDDASRGLTHDLEVLHVGLIVAPARTPHCVDLRQHHATTLPTS